MSGAWAPWTSLSFGPNARARSAPKSQAFRSTPPSIVNPGNATNSKCFAAISPGPPSRKNDLLQASGDIILRLKTPYGDGTTHLLFSGLEFVEKLAALIPPPRIHLTRFFGCLAPHATIRTLIVPKTQTVPPPLPVHATTADPSGTTPAAPTRPKRWAELLARVFGIDMQKCPDCGGPWKIISAILEPNAIKTILMYLRLPDKPPPPAPARIPSQMRVA